ncbi:hypothetical protein OJ253_254 [Cryptosporidium canis]|uniref:Uncharacterized protein n=1 Tax=Cryptosporidium canis TaxID=195482 RepID=A0A9D5HYN9_9CRYT|nr:hypothetical protein OJ253_254 [Cryptosporidium canis]
MDEDCFNVHSPGVFEARRAGKSSRKSAPAVVRAMPRINKRYKKPPFSVDKIEEMCTEFIDPYKQIYRDAVNSYTERKIKSKRRCELFKKALLDREDLYFNSLKKCVTFDTNWAKEKLKQEENKILNFTNDETKSVVDIYLLRSVANEKANKQRDLLLKLQQFWCEFREKIAEKSESEKSKILDMIKYIYKPNLNRVPNNRQYYESSMDISSSTMNNGKLSLDQYEQIKLMAAGYEVTTGKFSVMIDNLTKRIDSILGTEKRLNHVAKAIVLH